MTKARLDGLYLLLLGSALFVSMGSVVERTGSGKMEDFKVVYYQARCLLQHGDPYKPSETLRAYRAEGGKLPRGPLQDLTPNVYPPTASIFIAPFCDIAVGACTPALDDFHCRKFYSGILSDVGSWSRSRAATFRLSCLFSSCEQHKSAYKRESGRYRDQFLHGSRLVFPSGSVCLGRRSMPCGQPGAQAARCGPGPALFPPGGRTQSETRIANPPRYRRPGSGGHRVGNAHRAALGAGTTLQSSSEFGARRKQRPRTRFRM